MYPDADRTDGERSYCSSPLILTKNQDSAIAELLIDVRF